MKSKSLALISTLIVCLIVAVAPCVAGQAATTTTDTGAIAWITANSAAIFGLLLAISEFMALIPGLKGNGILDSIIKTLKALAGKNDGQ